MAQERGGFKNFGAEDIFQKIYSTPPHKFYDQSFNSALFLYECQVTQNRLVKPTYHFTDRIIIPQVKYVIMLHHKSKIIISYYVSFIGVLFGIFFVLNTGWFFIQDEPGQYKMWFPICPPDCPQYGGTYVWPPIFFGGVKYVRRS